MHAVDEPGVVPDICVGRPDHQRFVSTGIDHLAVAVCYFSDVFEAFKYWSARKNTTSTGRSFNKTFWLTNGVDLSHYEAKRMNRSVLCYETTASLMLKFFTLTRVCLSTSFAKSSLDYRVCKPRLATFGLERF